MSSPRVSSVVFLAALMLSPFAPSSTDDARFFDDPIDALSVTLSSQDATADISYRTQNGWSEWETLHVENEQDPTILESNLILFPETVTQIRLRGLVAAVHPIAVSHEPARYALAASGNVGKPRILSRKDWGADESFLITTKEPPALSGQESGDNGDTSATGTSQRVKDCQDAQLNYPQEFKTTSKHVMQTPDGERLRWAQDYSQDIDLLVVHHTAMKVTGDARSGEERIRALYAYHANNRGWGDIGYHYLVDESGQIYEGKAGGKYVVGGHAYCNNIGTIGIALLGNFEVEQPTQQQMKSLQWLLGWLGDTYDVPLAGKVKFHGKTLTTIVGHRDLLSTDCPGTRAYEVLDQVRSHAASGDTDAAIVFPKRGTGTYTNRTDERRNQRLGNQPQSQTPVFPKEGVSPLGSTSLDGRPGSQVLISMRYQAPQQRVSKGSKIAEVTRSAQGIGVWQEKDGAFTRASSSLALPTLVDAGGTSLLRLKIQFPSEAGSYTLSIGPWTYQLEVSGRRSRATPTESNYQSFTQSSARAPAVRSSIKSSASSSRRTNSRSSVSSAPSATSDLIRIRLSQTVPGGSISIQPKGSASVLSITTSNSAVTDKSAGLTASGDGKGCSALGQRMTVTGDIVRISSSDGFLQVHNVSSEPRLLRGVIECRMVDGALVLINELPLEEYLWGLAEEPDTEPYEKQRAFAITARTYAAYYMDNAHRKFPGKPYDGSDSPAEFQSYKGADFEASHTQWVKAVKNTESLVLRYQGQIIRPPYFSSDDGQTRTPVEAGWGATFPFAEIYASKPDPWCAGMQLRGHGVGMSGCGSEGQANEGKKAEEILSYYYPGTVLSELRLP
jgi:peptidoglycan hydrolase-like amidase